MINVRYQCPHCGQIFEGSGEYVGTETECPSCGKAFMLEAIDEAPATRPNGLMCYCGIFSNYVKFSGRASRREFWYAFLFHFIATFIAGFIDGVAFDEYDDYPHLFSGLYALASLLPMIAIQFRRLHDTNKNGWWWLLLPMPVINLAYLVWLIDDGDRGQNRFGPDPKGRRHLPKQPMP